MRTYNNQSTGVLISQPLVITATEIRLDSLLIFFLSLSLSLSLDWLAKVRATGLRSVRSFVGSMSEKIPSLVAHFLRGQAKDLSAPR